MLLDFYGLHQQPFGVTPDPAFLYPSRTHCEALDSLTEGILGGRGFLALIAEPGLGKTTLLYQVLDGLRGTARAAFLFQTQCNSREFFQYLLSELGVDATGMGLVAMHNKLNEMLFAEMLAGKRFVLIVDEAQNLDDSVLETIRLLSNFETSHSKLLQIVLAGQPQLREKLLHERLSQLLQRIAVLNHLEPLSAEETAGYVRHRLKVAGHSGEPLFEPEALALVAERSRGVPRIINRICFQALEEGYSRGRRTLSADIIDKADRKLRLSADSRPAPAPVPPKANFQKTAAASAAPTLTYKPLGKSGPPHWVVWMCALGVVVLSLAVATPGRAWRTLLEAVHVEAEATLVSVGNLADHEAVPDALKGSFARSSESSSGLDAAGVTGLGQIRAMGLGEFLDPSARPAGPTRTAASLASRVTLMRELGLKIRRIAIDPGHGGYDTGTVGPHGLVEKSLCLDVALRLGRLIEENVPGAEVIYTRTDDRYVPLEERTAIANRSKADLFISIHANSSDSSQARGVETYYLSLAASPGSMEFAARENTFADASLHDFPELLREIARSEKMEESKLLAVDLQNSLSERLELVSRHETNRGVKRAPFVVLTGASMPAVLSEISFVSNASDESLLRENDQRDRIAEGLCRGIMAYLAGLGGAPDRQPKLVSENHPASSAEFSASTGRARP